MPLKYGRGGDHSELVESGNIEDMKHGTFCSQRFTPCISPVLHRKLGNNVPTILPFSLALHVVERIK